ncbi:hypothetical protein, partial [Microvirga pakistanensis]|uniref:hypothetical protein n=1 Tax=Microvirga pakistanensis TaxID=1682650 RepID=UPI00141AEB78
RFEPDSSLSQLGSGGLLAEENTAHEGERESFASPSLGRRGKNKRGGRPAFDPKPLDKGRTDVLRKPNETIEANR